jgi:cytoskeleton protein RodZ
VYVRGHLRRYGDFVGEQGAELVNAYSARAEARPPPPDLTQIPQAERRSDPRRLVTPLVGLGCALVLALAIWWVLAGTKSGSIITAATPQPAPAAAAAPAPTHTPPVQPASAGNANAQSATAAPVATPVPAVNANTADAARREAGAESAAPARETRLRLELSNESWVEVYDARGERLFYDVAGAGSVQSIAGRPPLRVVLGNAAAVTVQVDGRSRDIPAGALDGEGARFVVNRSGSLSRAR